MSDERREAAFTVEDAKWVRQRLKEEGSDPSVVIAVMIEWGLLRLAARLTESSRTPTDSAVPEPADPPNEGPKVVGWINPNFPDKAGWNYAEIRKKPADASDVPVILQSEHEEAVRALVERVEKKEESVEHWYKQANKMALVVDQRAEEIARLKAENEGLREDRNDLQVRLDNANEAVEIEGAENERLREEFGRVEGLEDRVHELLAQITRVEAERDAYADPKNWGPVRFGGDVHDALCEYHGPTPSDSTETEQDDFEKYADEKVQEIARIMDGTESEPESVKGEVDFAFEGQEENTWWFVRLPDTTNWRPGDRVRITKIPQTGGNDGD